MPEQGRLFDPHSVSARQFTPVESARQGAAALTGGSWSDEGLGDLQNDHTRGHATFLAYRNAIGSGSPETPGLRDSYASMAEHVGRQYKHITSPVDQGGMGLTHVVTPHDPYSNAWSGGHDGSALQSMADDITTNGRIQTMATSSTGKHEYFSDEQNDQFRAVHDIFGHAATGRGFSRHGEEAAFRSHRQMFPPEAHAALATETRGQNSYLNYGPGGFASQEGRLVGLPKWAETDDPVPDAPRSRVRPYGQRRMF